MRSLILHELGLFRKLSPRARALFLSTVLFSLTQPVIGIFSHALVWRLTHSLVATSLYLSVLYVGAVLGFLICGGLSRWISITHWFSIGLILQGVSNGILYLLQPRELPLLLGSGFCFGLCAGAYWSARNCLSTEVVADGERDYFVSLEWAANLLSAVIVPTAVGFLVEGTLSDWTVEERYRIVYFLSLGLLTLGAIAIAWAKLPHIAVSSAWNKSTPPLWRDIQRLTIFVGLADAVSLILPTITVLVTIGQEIALGSYTALSNILCALLTYLFGRHYSATVRTPQVRLSLACFGLVAILHAIAFGRLSAILLVLFYGFARTFMWSSTVPLSYQAVAKVSGPGDSFGFLVNREAMLSIGRLSGCVILCGLFFWGGLDAALRYAPLAVFAAMIPVALLVAQLVSDDKSSAPIPLCPEPQSPSQSAGA